jgi:TRAP-type mannitol/chloroaromatic compound transport system permease large subunit
VAGKIIVYALVIFMVAFFLEYFEIVDIPYFDIPNFLEGKKALVHNATSVLESLK